MVMDGGWHMVDGTWWMAACGCGTVVMQPSDAHAQFI